MKESLSSKCQVPGAGAGDRTGGGGGGGGGVPASKVGSHSASEHRAEGEEEGLFRS